MKLDFKRFIGIDYSGAATCDQPIKGIRVFVAGGLDPIEVPSPHHARGLWSRQALALWLQQTLQHGPPALVGIDHALSFPLTYFAQHKIPLDWDALLADFCRLWPLHQPEVSVDALRKRAANAQRLGNARWRRLTDQVAGAKSVFHFDVPGSVAKSTFTGLPWVQFLRQSLGAGLHCWPFDGWKPTEHASVLVEAYPSLCNRILPRKPEHTPDQHDAYSVARWMVLEAQAQRLSRHFTPQLTPGDCAIARIEGWIFGAH